MQGDTLVIQVNERNNKDDCDGTIAFIFYDYKLRLYGVKFGSVDLNSFYELDSNKLHESVNSSFSYYASKKDVVSMFIDEIIPQKKVDEITLTSYSDLPKDSDEITFEMLLENASMDNVHIYYDKPNNPRHKVEMLLDMITDMYNIY